MPFDAAGFRPPFNINQRHVMAPRHQKTKKKITAPPRALPTLNPHAAGIDIGAREIWVAVPPAAGLKSVRPFETFTDALLQLRDWLIACGVTTVAMESTGVYWIPLFQILEAAGLRIPINSDSDSKIFGQASGIFGQLSERSDAPGGWLTGCPNWSKDFVSSRTVFRSRRRRACLPPESSRGGRPQMG